MHTFAHAAGRDTKIGTQLEAKILRPMAYNRRLAKPLLVITVTDGEPSDTPVDKIVSVIKECSKKMVSAGYGPNAVAFQFAQVGGPEGVKMTERNGGRIQAYAFSHGDGSVLKRKVFAHHSFTYEKLFCVTMHIGPIGLAVPCV